MPVSSKAASNHTNNPKGTNIIMATIEEVAQAIIDALTPFVGGTEDEAPAAKPARKTTAKKVAEPEPEEDDDSDDDDADDYSAMKLGELRKLAIERGFTKAEAMAAGKEDLVASLEADDNESDDEDDADDADDVDDDTDDEDTDDDEEESDDEDSTYTEAELKKLSPAQLKAVAADLEIDIKKGSRVPTIIAAILEAQEDGDGDDADDEDVDDEDDSDDDEESEYHTDDDVEGLNLSALKKMAVADGYARADLEGYDIDAMKSLLTTGE